MNGEQVAELLEMMAEMARLHDGAQDEVAGIGAVVLAELPTILQHLRAQTGWRTMDSAPKDGTRVLGWEPEVGPYEVMWLNGEWWDVWEESPAQPTHWMPLPPPPGDAP